MSWRKADKLDSSYESVNVQWFRVAHKDGSFDNFSNISELIMNAHTHLNDDLYKIFAKYLFMNNKKATVSLAYRYVAAGAEETCLIFIGYDETYDAKVVHGRQQVLFPNHCGKAVYTATMPDGVLINTTLQEVDTETICNFKMPGEAFRAYRKDFNLKNLKLME